MNSQLCHPPAGYSADRAGPLRPARGTDFGLIEQVYATFDALNERVEKGDQARGRHEPAPAQRYPRPSDALGYTDFSARGLPVDQQPQCLS
jgi:hypothetical protein